MCKGRITEHPSLKILVTQMQRDSLLLEIMQKLRYQVFSWGDWGVPPGSGNFARPLSQLTTVPAF